MNKSKIIKIIGFIVLDLILLFGYLYIRQFTSINLLRKEIEELSTLDVTKDRFNSSCVTRGGYCKVEKAIKDYLDDYAKNIQDISSMVSNEEFNNILSFSNIEKDGPSFNNSLKYLEDFSKSYNEKVEYILSRLNEDTIKNHINSYTNNSYYRSLYNELMIKDGMFNDFFKTKELMLNTKSYVNSFCNNSRDLLIFLRDHSDSWFLEDGEIKFRNHDEYNEYIQLLDKVNKDENN